MCSLASGMKTDACGAGFSEIGDDGVDRFHHQMPRRSAPSRRRLRSASQTSGPMVRDSARNDYRLTRRNAPNPRRRRAPRSTSSPSLAKFADRIDGAITGDQLSCPSCRSPNPPLATVSSSYAVLDIARTLFGAALEFLRHVTEVVGMVLADQLAVGAFDFHVRWRAGVRAEDRIRIAADRIGARRLFVMSAGCRSNP